MKVKIDQLKTHVDMRGIVFEPIDDESIFNQKNNHVVISKPGVVRGNHYHLHGTETIAVMGPALLRFKEATEIYDFEVPSKQVYKFVIPQKVTHAIKNIGKTDSILITIPGFVAGFDSATWANGWQGGHYIGGSWNGTDAWVWENSEGPFWDKETGGQPGSPPGNDFGMFNGWLSNEPNNTGEDYLSYLKKPTGEIGWADVFNNGVYVGQPRIKHYIVEVPESATMLLLGFGLIGLVGSTRKRIFKK